MQLTWFPHHEAELEASLAGDDVVLGRERETSYSSPTTHPDFAPLVITRAHGTSGARMLDTSMRAHDLLPLMRRLVAIGMFLLLGCTREVAAGLEEGEANRGVVALAHAGVDAEKVADTQSEGRYKLVVGRDEATIAISVLSNEEIPRPKPAVANQGLVPSPEAERAAHILAVSSQIERSLAAVDGVHDARVHLDIPVADPLLASLGNDAKLPKPTASVLIRHRSASPPLTPDDVKKLVAGAVSGLSPDAVAVVFVPVPKAQTAGDRELAHLGPVAVTRGSLPTLRAIAIGVLLTLALLGGAVLALAVRLRRAKEATEDAAPSLAR